MDPIAIYDEIDALAKEIGGARIFVSVSRDNHKPSSGQIASLHASKPGTAGTLFYVYADDWPALFATARAKWAEVREEKIGRIVKEMALAIIRITAELGECSDAALRAEFDAADVAAFGDDACAKADEMASNGPFSITRLAGANAA